VEGDLAVGRGVVEGAEPEERLEGCHRGAAPVVAEDVLVEVDGQVFVGGAAVGTVHPGLEVGDRAVRAGQQLLAGRYRAVHADGRIYRGSFQALPVAQRYTRAAHLQGGSVPVSVRFSEGGGNPDVTFNATVGMATRFYLPNGRTTNLVMLSQLLFPTRTPEDLLEAISLVAPVVAGTGVNREALKPFLGRHPEVANVLKMRAAAQAPIGFGNSEYHAIHVSATSARRARGPT
jgi:hypothetical protein